MRERFSPEKLTEPAVRITSARPRLESSEQRSEVEGSWDSRFSAQNAVFQGLNPNDKLCRIVLNYDSSARK